MRNSLKGYARNTLLTLPESASPIHSIDKLEGIYGNVYSNDTLLLSFYAEKQMNGQSVADYGMTLEYILQKVYETGILNPEGRNDIIFVSFGGTLFQQVVGIPMGTNCAPLLADLFLYSYESEFLQKLVKDKKIHEARAFNFTYRYIDDVLSINNSRFAEFLPLIYPPEWKLKRPPIQLRPHHFGLVPRI